MSMEALEEGFVANFHALHTLLRLAGFGTYVPAPVIDNVINILVFYPFLRFTTSSSFTTFVYPV